MSISVSAIITAYTSYNTQLGVVATAKSAVQSAQTTYNNVVFPVDVAADADYNTPLAAQATALATLQGAQATLYTDSVTLRTLELAVIAIMPPMQWVGVGGTVFIGFKPQPLPTQQTLKVINTTPTQDFPLF